MGHDIREVVHVYLIRSLQIIGNLSTHSHSLSKVAVLGLMVYRYQREIRRYIYTEEAEHEEICTQTGVLHDSSGIEDNEKLCNDHGRR